MCEYWIFESLVPSSNTILPDLVLTQIYVAVLRHLVTVNCMCYVEHVDLI